MAFDLLKTFPTLQRAPITEALIDIRAEVPPSVKLSQLATFNLGIEDRFSERIERHSIETRIEFQPGAAPRVVAPSDEPDGYLFRAPQERLIAQARLDGFTLGRLRPYHDGDTFIAQARDLWTRYVGLASPIRVNKLAIKNVNRIEMVPGTELQRYLLTGPEISRALPQQMLHFFLRLMVPDAESGAVAIVTETIGPADGEASSIPLIFDIEAVLDVDLPANSQQIWDTIAILRALKNRIFFRSLTAECLEAFR